MKKPRSPFVLEKYIEGMAWRAFRQSSDPSMDFEDFLQDARLAIIKAGNKYDGNRGASKETYGIAAARNAFISKWYREKRRRPTKPISDSVQAQQPTDLFLLRITEVFSSQGNQKAKQLLNTFTANIGQMSTYSLAELRRLSGMDRREFQMALAELAKF